MRARYEVTLYQMGWRLGGKLASGRQGPEARSVEHGLHVWFGFYNNAFRLAQGTYARWAKPHGCPFQTWQDAFESQNYTPIGEIIDGEYAYWKAVNDLFEEHVEPTLRGPVFVHDYPAAICPLATPHRSDPALHRRPVVERHLLHVDADRLEAARRGQLEHGPAELALGAGHQQVAGVGHLSAQRSSRLAPASRTRVEDR